MKKFDYKSDYKKFQPKSKVKITFMDGEKEITKKVRIISINAKGISFEDKETVYECSPSEIKNIRKRNKKLLALIIFFVVFLIFSAINFMYSKYRAVSAYGTAYVEDDIASTWYGVRYGERLE